MIESLIVRPHARARHLQAPLLKEREEYLSHRLRLGHELRYLRFKASILVHAIRLMKISQPRTIGSAEIQRAAEVWANDAAFHKTRPASNRSSLRFYSLALDFFRYHGWLTEPVAPGQAFSSLLADFTLYLREAKGLASGTIRNYNERTAHFLKWIVSRRDCFADVTLLDVDDYLERKHQEGFRPGSIQIICQALRAFFRFAYCHRACSRDIASCIRGPSIPKYHEIPQGPCWREVRKLLKFPAKMSPGEIRAKAILTLCAIYGMRSCEIAGLRLEDFDWNSEALIIRRGKRGRVQQFPLQYEVGDAVLQYLKFVRPRCSCRDLFVTRYHPHRPVLPTTLRPIVTRRMIELGIKSEQMGPHSLRHSCATELLKKGSSLKDLADFLGHRNLGSVSVYAKHDPRMLRKVAEFSLAGVR